MRAYPAPDRQRWVVMVQHLNGTQIAGCSDSEVIERWRDLHWATPGLTMPDFKARIVDYARVIWGARLIGITGTTPDEQFLDALAAEGVLAVIRK